MGSDEAPWDATTGLTHLWLVLLAALVAAGLMAGCRRSADTSSDETIRIEVVKPVFPPPSGMGYLTFRLSDEKVNPSTPPRCKFRGRHEPRRHDADPGPPRRAAGRASTAYHQWTMSGDWIVTVEATLSDDRRAARSFNFAVTGQEGDMAPTNSKARRSGRLGGGPDGCSGSNRLVGRLFGCAGDGLPVRRWKT